MILICKIYEDNKHCYGYRQIALAINELVVKVNHKKIKHLMYKMKLFGIRIKDWQKHSALNGLIFHTDQICQYQHATFQSWLNNHGIEQAMSRKGNQKVC